MPLIRNKRKGNISKSGAITISPKNQLVEIDNQQGQIPIDLSINGRQLLRVLATSEQDKRKWHASTRQQRGLRSTR